MLQLAYQVSVAGGHFYLLHTLCCNIPVFIALGHMLTTCLCLLGVEIKLTVCKYVFFTKFLTVKVVFL